MRWPLARLGNAVRASGYTPQRMARTVWVLGAGFSRPLGGPLLRDMLGLSATDRVVASFPTAQYPLLYGQAASSVRGVYRTWGPAADERAGYRKHWEHAEEFLEFLDIASSQWTAGQRSSPTLQLLQTFGPTGEQVPPVSAAARRLMAAECCAFLKGADPAYEKWQPYLRWVRELGDTDTVVTFNYDTVVETAASAPAGGPNRVCVPLPREPLPPGQVPILKLHGSVDWRLSGDTLTRVPNSPDFALAAPDDELVLASPGPTKGLVVDRLLAPLWEEALRRLRDADVVVFVGYRFPPTDDTARTRFLAALKANATPRLSIHTVLGPDVGSVDSQRLRGMLESVLLWNGRVRAGTIAQGPRFSVVPHPLGAEDFLSLYVPGALLTSG